MENNEIEKINIEWVIANFSQEFLKIKNFVRDGAITKDSILLAKSAVTLENLAIVLSGLVIEKLLNVGQYRDKAINRATKRTKRWTDARLNLAFIHQDILEAFAIGDISQSHVYELEKVQDEPIRKALIEIIDRDDLSAENIAQIVAGINSDVPIV